MAYSRPLDSCVPLCTTDFDSSGRDLLQDGMWRVRQNVDAIHSQNGSRGLVRSPLFDNWTWIIFYIIIGPREIFSLPDINTQMAEVNKTVRT